MRKILHLDMDAFYASIEIRDDPSLQGKPVVVGGLTDRGVVCAASYEAREYGVHSAMATRRARQICPKGVFLRPRMAHYDKVSDETFRVFREVTDLVEPVSLDECYMDVTENRWGLASATDVARGLKDRIRQEFRLTVSAGVAPCKLVAKIASDLRKPDGLVVVRPEQVLDFLHELPVGKIPGVGPVTKQRLESIGVGRIAQLRDISREALEAMFGKWGHQLFEFARGIDNRAVQPFREAKSLGSENTFEKDTSDLSAIVQEIQQHAQTVARRLKRLNRKARSVTLKIRYSDFSTITRALTLGTPFNDSLTMLEVGKALLERTEAGRRPVRLVGIYASGLVAPDYMEQLTFF